MTIRGRTDEEIRDVIRRVVFNLWNKEMLTSPEIAKVVRVNQQEVERIINEEAW